MTRRRRALGWHVREALRTLAVAGLAVGIVEADIALWLHLVSAGVL